MSPLTLQDRLILDPFLKRANLYFSEYTFANLYLFREKHEYRLIVEGADYLIRGRSYDNHIFLMPITYPIELIQKNGPYLLNKYGAEFFFPLLEEHMVHLNAQYSENDSDYLFHREKIATYPGRNLSKKRNLVKQFISQYSYELIPINDSFKKDMTQVVTLWQEQLGQISDCSECLEAINCWKELELEGAVLLVNGKVEGFLLGEYLHDSFIIHFAKANREIKGIYQFLYSKFCQTLPASIVWINMEQDLGNQSLRKAKHSYQPDKMLFKMRLFMQLIENNSIDSYSSMINY